MAKGLVKMGVGCVILSEMKITNDRYTRMKSGYKVLATKAPSKHQGGIALLWQPEHKAFEIEATKILTPNLITFQLVMGDERYYVIGIYIPPNNTEGGNELRVAWEVCPANCHPIVMGDLYINLGNPNDDREVDIANLLDEINLVDMTRKFALQRCRQQKARTRWTWRQKHRGHWIHSQPDYIMAREGDIRRFRKVGFQSPPIHDSDHHTVVAHMWKGKGGSLKTYPRNRQRFPITLPPGEQDKKTLLFEELKALCDHPDPKQHPRNNWISVKTWRAVAHRTMLCRTGQLCRLGSRRMKRETWNSLKDDRIAQTKQVGQSIEAELRGGDVQEAFRLIKGWYRAATEVEARPCYQTMARKNEEWFALYARRTPLGEPLPINIAPTPIPDGVPTDSEVREAVGELTNGRSGGASKMRAEHMKEWLKEIRREEDPKQSIGNWGAGEAWCLLMRLVGAVWETGTIP